MFTRILYIIYIPGLPSGYMKMAMLPLEISLENRHFLKQQPYRHRPCSKCRVLKQLLVNLYHINIYQGDFVMAKKVSELINGFKNGEYDGRLASLYADPEMVPMQRERYVKALNGFLELYGDKEAEIYSAPGRTEIGGNHTDHQHGRVLAGSVNLDAIGVAAKLDEMKVSVKSEGYNHLNVKLDNLKAEEKHFGSSYALIRGVAAGILDAGYKTGGFEAYITSNVLSGSGLSSSAAYENLIGNIFSGLYNDGKIDAVKIAQISQFAENVYFGKPCGLMDQMASSVGSMVTIDFCDPSEPVIHKVDADFGNFGHSLCIVDTKGSHADLTDDYAAVPQELKKVCAFFGKEFLRDVDEDEFYAKLPQVRETAGDRGVLRAIHIYEDNKRVEAQVAALERGDFDGFKELIKGSGNSSFKYLQNVYSTHKTQEQGVSIGLAVSEKVLGDKGVCRVHGGGFAGTIQAFVPNDLVATYKETLEKVFGDGACYVLKIRPEGGCKVL